VLTLIVKYEAAMPLPSGDSMQESESNRPSYGDPPWLTSDDDTVAKARAQLVGDYNMWVQLSGGDRELAKQILLKDFPRGPFEGGSDENLRAHLASRFPWLWAYTAFQYRAGIFNTITFIIMLAGLIYIALVYVPRDQRAKTTGSLDTAPALLAVSRPG
jgi:hypothetical protein